MPLLHGSRTSVSPPKSSTKCPNPFPGLPQATHSKPKKDCSWGVLCLRCLLCSFWNLKCAMATCFWGWPSGWNVEPLLCWICAEESFLGMRAKLPRYFGYEVQTAKEHYNRFSVFFFCVFCGFYNFVVPNGKKGKFLCFTHASATQARRRCDGEATQATQVARSLHAGADAGATQATQVARRPRRLHAGVTQTQRRRHAGHASSTQPARRSRRPRKLHAGFTQFSRKAAKKSQNSHVCDLKGL